MKLIRRLVKPIRSPRGIIEQVTKHRGHREPPMSKLSRVMLAMCQKSVLEKCFEVDFEAYRVITSSDAGGFRSDFKSAQP